jgi:hypothetical protein
MGLHCRSHICCLLSNISSSCAAALRQVFSSYPMATRQLPGSLSSSCLGASGVCQPGALFPGQQRLPRYHNGSRVVGARSGVAVALFRCHWRHAADGPTCPAANVVIMVVSESAIVLSFNMLFLPRQGASADKLQFWATPS